MPARVVVCPFVPDPELGGVTPKAGLLVDPGRAARGARYSFAVVETLPSGEVLCLVAGADLSALDADPDISAVPPGPRDAELREDDVPHPRWRTGKRHCARYRGASTSWTDRGDGVERPRRPSERELHSIFADAFTDTNGTDLVSHTPDTGTSWTEAADGSGNRNIEVQSNEAAPDATETQTGIWYTAQGTYPSAEYDVLADFPSVGVSPGVAGLIARWTDSDNNYTLLVNSNAGDDILIVKRDGGTQTILAQADNDHGSPVSDVKFEIRDAAKKAFIGGSEILSTADNAVTSTGEGGLGFGATGGTGGFGIRGTDRIDNFEIVAAASGAADPHWIMGQQQPRFDPPEVIGY